MPAIVVLGNNEAVVAVDADATREVEECRGALHGRRGDAPRGLQGSLGDLFLRCGEQPDVEIERPCAQHDGPVLGVGHRTGEGMAGIGIDWMRSARAFLLIAPYAGCF